MLCERFLFSYIDNKLEIIFFMVLPLDEVG